MPNRKKHLNDLAVDIKDVEKKLEEMKIKDLEIGGMREFKPQSPLAIAVYVIGLAMSFFHIWVLTIRAIDPWYFGPCTWCSPGRSCSCWFPAGSRKTRARSTSWTGS